MGFMPTIISPDVDPDLITDGVRAALIANTTIATALDIAHNPKRIAPDLVEEGVTPPYITISLPSVLVEGPYNRPSLNALVDIGVYTEGSSTTLTRQLVLAALKALMVDSWSIAGYYLNSASMKDGAGNGFRPATSVIGGRIRRGRQFTFRVRASKE